MRSGIWYDTGPVLHWHRLVDGEPQRVSICGMQYAERAGLDRVVAAALARDAAGSEHPEWMLKASCGSCWRLRRLAWVRKQKEKNRMSAEETP